jgi:hypothetical protein
LIGEVLAQPTEGFKGITMISVRKSLFSLRSNTFRREATQLKDPCSLTLHIKTDNIHLNEYSTKRIFFPEEKGWLKINARSFILQVL